MPKASRTVYWDSCLFLCKLKREDDRVRILDALIADAESGNLSIVTSAIAKLETVHLGQKKPTSADVEKINKFFQHRWLHQRIVDPLIIDQALALRRQSDLRFADSIHVATALRVKAAELHTWDPVMLGLADEFAGLRIIAPFHEQPELF